MDAVAAPAGGAAAVAAEKEEEEEEEEEEEAGTVGGGGGESGDRLQGEGRRGRLRGAAAKVVAAEERLERRHVPVLVELGHRLLDARVVLEDHLLQHHPFPLGGHPRRLLDLGGGGMGREKAVR